MLEDPDVAARLEFPRKTDHVLGPVVCIPPGTRKLHGEMSVVEFPVGKPHRKGSPWKIFASQGQK